MHSVWAIAVNTLKQALRMKVALVFIILLLILLPLMGITLTGDGTAKGRLQVFVSYSLSLTSLLLCLLTILVSVYSLTSDIKDKQIFTVLTKPVRRVQLILGKLLGVILLDVILLFIFSFVIYSIALYLPYYLNVAPSEHKILKNEFFTARAALQPLEDDLSDEIEREYKKVLQQRDKTSLTLAKKIKEKITMQKKTAARAVPTGHELILKFHNVKPFDPNQNLFVRFKYDVSANPLDLKIYGKWVVGDDRQTVLETPIYSFEQKDLIRTFHEFEVPADTIAYDNYLAIGFYNDPQFNDTVVIFEPDEGLEVLYKAGTFTANFAKAALLIMFRLIFLAVLGITAASFLSFPVAILLCMVVFFTAMLSGFVIDSFRTMGEAVSGFYNFTFTPLVGLLPQFDRFNPVKFLASARLLNWSLILEAVGLMVIVKTVLLLLLALWIFSRREVAKITI